MIHEIGLSEYMNCVLVQENVRNAMMIQSIDYGENTLGPITQSKLKAISTNFPDLIQSSLEGNIIISKTKYDEKDITEKKLGEILGYPSVDNLNDLQYCISINAEFEDKSVQIYGMKSKDGDQMLIAKKAFTVLKMDPNLDIKDVNVIIKKDINPESIIDKLISYKTLTDGEIDEIGNYLYNTGFSDLIMYTFEYDNPIHIGILCTLISYFINDPIMAFAPLQRFPNEYKRSDEIVKKLEANIINTLNGTKKRGKTKA